MQHSDGSYQQNPYPSGIIPCQSAELETTVEREGVVTSRRSNDHATDVMEMTPNPFTFCMNRSDDEEFGVYQLDSKTGDFPDISGYCGQVQFDEIDNDYRSHKVHPDGEATETKSLSSLHNSFDSQDSDGVQQLVKKAEHDIGDECEGASSLYPSEYVEYEPLDFENNGVLCLPAEPEDEREAFLFDDDDDGDAAREWGYLRSSSSFGSGEYRNRDKSNEEHKKIMENVVDGHFRALVAQLLQVENLTMGEEDEKEN